jgi:hypothetical protein
MTRLQRVALGGPLLALAMTAAALAVPAEPAGKVALRTISYAELGKLVRGLRGKVVVVDFWQNT